MLPSIGANIEISPGQAGFALSLMWASMATVMYPSGRLSDEISRKGMLTVSLGLLALGCGVLVFAFDYVTFTVGTLLIGIGSGIYSPANFAQLSDLFAENEGIAFGVNESFINLGGIVASGLAILALTHFVWQSAFLPLLIAILFVLVSMHAVHRDQYAVSRPHLEVRSTIIRLFHTRELHLVLLVSALFNLVWQGTASFLPTFLQASRGLTTAMASNAFAGVFLIGAFSNPIIGKFGDTFGYLRLSAGMVFLTLIGVLSFLYGTSWPSIVFGVVASGVGLTSIWPVLNAYLMRIFPDEHKAGDFGITLSASVVIGSVGPTYVGVLAEIFDYWTSFAGLVPVMFLCLVLLVYESRTTRA